MFGEPGHRAKSDLSTCCLHLLEWDIVVECVGREILTDPSREVDEDCFVVLRKKWKFLYPKYFDQIGYVKIVGSFLGGGEDVVAKVEWEDGDVCCYETKMLARVIEN